MGQRPIDFEQELAKLVKFHRNESGLSREKLSVIAGVGKTVIFDIEHGKKTIRLNTLLKILKVLNIKLTANSPLISKYVSSQMKEQG